MVIFNLKHSFLICSVMNKTESKEMAYISPETLVVKVATEGMVCTSPTQDFTLGNPFGGSTEEDW